jgi:hypothetical protein
MTRWLVVLLAFLLAPAVIADDLQQTEKRHLQVLSCSYPSGFYLAATLQLQTFMPAYCQPWELTEISAFLFDYFQRYSAYDPTVGSLEIIPTIATPCKRRNLQHEIGNNTTDSDESQRRLQSGGFYPIIVYTKCKFCGKDNADGRYLQQRNLAPTSPVTIRIKTDGFPTEVSYRIRTTIGSGTTIYSSPVYTSLNTEYTQVLYLEPGQLYKMVLRDAYGDGWCCTYGSGYAQVLAGTTTAGAQLAYDRSNFGVTRTISFVAPLYTEPIPTTSALILPDLQRKYSDYLTFYLQQAYQYDMTKCLYGKFPVVAVALAETTATTATSGC